MYGSAKIEADSLEEALDLASTELINWSGAGTDLDEVEVDGSDVEP
jgi:hypothetical protein